MDVQRDVWQEKTEYANGITFWIEDPALLTGALEKLQSIPGYNWDSYFINTNNAEYDRAVGPLTQMGKNPVSYVGSCTCSGDCNSCNLSLLCGIRNALGKWGFFFYGICKEKNHGKTYHGKSACVCRKLLIAVPVVFFGVRFLGSAIDISGAVLKAGNVLAVGVGGLIFCAVITVLSSVKIMRVNPKEILVMPN